jgi:hypothetical protein
MYKVKAAEGTLVRKICTINIDEIDYWCQFHQHFTRAFLANILVPKNFKPKTQLCNFWCQNIGAKCACKIWMKLTPDRCGINSSRTFDFEGLAGLDTK